MLEIWERESGNIKTFKCPFERLEYDAVFGPGGNIPKSKSEGHLRYAKPDKGMFRIDEIRYYDAESREWKPRENDPGEHWVCDGASVYEYNAAKKQLIVRELPPDQRGTAIADGPLPFLFGAKRKKLRQRYFMRITQVTDSQIWLVAYPRTARDAASYRYVELILDREKFLPAALQVYLPGGKSRTVYVFGDARINDPLSMFGGVFLKPRTPLGWKKVIEKIPTGPTHQASRPGAPAAAPR